MVEIPLFICKIYKPPTASKLILLMPISPFSILNCFPEISRIVIQTGNSVPSMVKDKDTTVTMLQHIMLSYYKRINSQQSFDGLFTAISKEMVEMDLVSRMIDTIWELIEIIASMEGIDFIELQEQIMRDDKVATIFLKMIPQRVLEKSA
jgi:hypothetical protein